MRLPRSPRPWSLDISARPQNMDILGKWYVNWLSAVRAVPAHLTQRLPYAFEIPSDFVLWRPWWMRASGKVHNGSQRKPSRFRFPTTLINVDGAEQGPGFRVNEFIGSWGFILYGSKTGVSLGLLHLTTVTKLCEFGVTEYTSYQAKLDKDRHGSISTSSMYRHSSDRCGTIGPHLRAFRNNQYNV